MFEMVKQWLWYDWLMFLFRTISYVSLAFTISHAQNELAIPLELFILLVIVAFSVPWFCLQINFRYYLITELMLSGGLSLYLSSFIPQSYLAFLVPTFMVAAHSYHKTYYWSGPITILFIPFLITQFSDQTNLFVMSINIALVFIMGFAFHLLIVNHRQSRIIREQNSVLEQYLLQVERMTVLEERNRLSMELHDTLGHSITSVIMGLETFRSEVITESGQTKLDSLLQLTRKSLHDARKYLHQMEPQQEILSLVQSFEQLIQEFRSHANVEVNLQTFGVEHPMTKQAKIAIYRCLQESLTNAVRHGQATEILVALQFEENQTRFEMKDNGSGVENVVNGFGLNAMKERVHNLQGHLSIYSKSGEGTLVTCTLPRLIEIQEEVIRILLVDDQPFIRESLRTILEIQKDFQVIGWAEDGVQAIQLCEQLQPQIVLMDLALPNMDGISATKVIKEKWPDIRVLILTTFQDTEKAVEVLRHGADSYLLKSIEPRELAETIRLVYRGGKRIAHDITNRLLEEFEMYKSKEPSVVDSRKDNIYGLTPREIEILQFFSQGFRIKTIATKVALSDGTVRNYASTIYSKLGVRNREEAVQKAMEIGLLQTN